MPETVLVPFNGTGLHSGKVLDIRYRMVYIAEPSQWGGFMPAADRSVNSVAR